MFVRTSYSRTQNIGEFETIYESFDSNTYSKCVCKFLNPFASRENGLRLHETASCKFYDKAGNFVAKFDIENIKACGLCESKQGIALIKDKYYVIPSYTKNETICYDIATNEKIWTSPIDKLTNIYVYKDKCFCDWSASRGGLKTIKAFDGSIINEIYKYKSELLPIVVDRIDERLLLVYDQGYLFVVDMETENIALLKTRFESDSKFFNLSSVVRAENSKEIIFRFKDYVTSGPLYLGGTAEWKYIDKSVRVDKLLDNLAPNPFGVTLPTDKVRLEKAYNMIWK